MGYYELLLAKKLSGGGGGGGSSIDVEPLSVVANGTYTAPEGTAYSPVNVNVEGLTVTDIIERTNFPQDIVYTGSHGLINSVFSKANGLKSFTATQNITIDSSAFYGAADLEAVDLPECNTNNQSVGNIFLDCTSLKTVNLPKVQLFGQTVFKNCTSLKNLVLPKITSLRDGFAYGSGLEKVDLAVCSSFAANSHFANSNLFILVLRRTGGVCSLGNINSFTGTPFASGGSGGTLYVPQALISSYQSATNWSTILGYANNSIQAIEGSIYENAYIDGTPIS